MNWTLILLRSSSGVIVKGFDYLPRSDSIDLCSFRSNDNVCIFAVIVVEEVSSSS